MTEGGSALAAIRHELLYLWDINGVAHCHCTGTCELYIAASSVSLQVERASANARYWRAPVGPIQPDTYYYPSGNILSTGDL